jgi:stearoyl-CoA desaturase (delta-9 desaturase)
VTLAIVIVPFAGLGVAVWLAWGHGLRLADVLLAAAFYLVTGLGVTVGFHRPLTRRPAGRPAFAVPVRDQPARAGPRRHRYFRTAKRQSCRHPV